MRITEELPKQPLRSRPFPRFSGFSSPEVHSMAEAGYIPRILIVDDERSIADTLAAVFRIKGHEAMAVYSAENAVETVEQFEPDIVLSDVMMGKMTGVDLAIYLSKARPECKVVLFSGQAATADLLAEANRKGHQFRLLAKPIHPQKLLDDIAAL
jgi:DNA-binding NtrC family response regulator